MKNFKRLLLLAMLGSVVTNTAFAQDDENDNVPRRSRQQQEDYENGDYMFPAQKRNNLMIMPFVGLGSISGDVKSTLGYGYGLNIQKAFGHVFSLRFQGSAGVTTGQNYQFSRGYYAKGGNTSLTDMAAYNAQYNNNPWDYYYGKGQPVQQPNTMAQRVFYNYRMNWVDVSAQGIVNLNNINFYKEQNKWGAFAMAGLGMMGYHTAVDALKEGATIGDRTKTYDFNNVATLSSLNTVFNFSKAKKEVIADIRDAGVAGGFKKANYESWAEHHVDEQGFYFGKDANGDKRYMTWNPMITSGVGIAYRLGRRVELGLEYRISWTNDDLLDGQRWQEPGSGGFGESAMTRDFDTYQVTSLNLGFRLGKGEESLWWSNPLATMASQMQDANKKLKTFENDEDGDGVADIFDKEPDTPEGATVDAAGRTLDSDGDGVPDYKDKEFASAPGANVDANGAAKDADGDNVPDYLDKEANTPAGAYVDARGKEIKFPTLNCADCIKEFQATVKPVVPPVAPSACNLPSIHFDADRSNVKSEFYPDMYSIAKYMQDNPSVRVRVTGRTDNGGQAMVQKRVENVINFIVGNFGISRDRFETAYGAASAGTIKIENDSHKNPKYAPLDYLNRRVELECIK